MKYITLEKDANIKISSDFEYFYNPDYIYMPIPKNMDIREGSLVLKDMLIGNLNSSVSGHILGATKANINGKITNTLVIENDFREKCVKIKKRNTNIDIMSLLKSLSIYDNELFNKFKSLKEIDNIVINAIDDELYINNNIINFKTNINDVLEFLDKLIFLYKAKETLIVIKNTESASIEECLNTIGTYPLVKLTLVEDYHLLGRKEFILNKLNKNENTTLYLTMNDLVKMEKIVKYNMIDSTKILTICGNCLKIGKVIIVKKYTLLKDILAKYIEFINDDYILIANSLINGYEVKDNLVITEEINAIYVMKKITYNNDKCIRCGKCISVCPKKIDIVKHLKNTSKSKLCFNCGLCNYVCPAHINITNILKGEE